MDDLQAKMDSLAEKLNKLQRHYVAGRPLVSDLEYDRLFDELTKLETQKPELRRSWSPTQRVGSDLSVDFPEVRHTVPVLSLDKAYSTAELSAWLEKTSKNAGRNLVVTMEQKMDGVSIVLYYENGELARAVTRGNGSVGNDVTANIKTIATVPLRLGLPLNLAVRGEIFLPKGHFEKINKTLDEPYANPRNLAAGSIRRIKSREVAQVPLQVFFYEAFFSTEGQPPNWRAPKGHLESLLMLKDLDFPLNPTLGIFTASGNLQSELGTELAKKATEAGFFVSGHSGIDQFVSLQTEGRSRLDWEMDGLVLKVDDLALREELGFTGHHPRWALAYKFESPQGETQVEEIFVQVGRTGRVTPVARVKPVQVGGSTITFITLHNEAYIQSLELGIGDLVTISRRGDVIPAVENVVEKISEHTWAFPENCPACSTGLLKDGAHHFCPNSLCPDQVRGRLVFFVGKGQMDIENLGPETIDVLLERGLVNDPADFFTCDYDSLLDVPGFGEKKIALIKEGVAAAKSRPFSTVLQALGVPDLGKKMAELLIEGGYRSFEAIVSVLSQTPDKLLEIAGIGEKTIQTLQKEFLSTRNLETSKKLKTAGLTFEAPEVEGPRGQSLTGTVWCVTGSFEAFQPRSLAEEEIKKRSGKVVGSVSGNTTHLLAGANAGSKLQKAEALKIAIVSEEEFKKLLENEPV